MTIRKVMACIGGYDVGANEFRKSLDSRIPNRETIL